MKDGSTIEGDIIERSINTLTIRPYGKSKNKIINDIMKEPIVLQKSEILKTIVSQNARHSGYRNILNIGLKAGLDLGISGGQLRFSQSSISPAPDYHSHFFYGLDLSIYFKDQFGVISSFDRILIRGTKFGQGSFSLFTADQFKGGLVFRFLVAKSVLNPEVVEISAGVNYSLLELHSELKNAMSKSAANQGMVIVFQSKSAIGLGFYSQINYKYFIQTHIYFNIGFGINYMNTKFPGATTKLDAISLQIPFGFGYSI